MTCFVGRCFVGRRFVGRCFLGRRFLGRRFLDNLHGTLRFLYLSHLLYGICVKIFIMNRYISKSYTTSKNINDRQYTGRGQL